MLTIRLQRVGRKNDASFRVVVTDHKHPPQTGKFLEVLGNYYVKKGDFKVAEDRVKYWMSQGASVSDNMKNLLIGTKTLEGRKKNVLNKKSPTKKRKDAKKAA